MQPVEKRNYNALLVPVDETVLPKAKAIIQDFNKKLNRLAESSPNRGKVYCFSSQLFCIN